MDGACFNKECGWMKKNKCGHPHGSGGTCLRRVEKLSENKCPTCGRGNYN